MERDDVCNRAKVGRLPEYLVRPGIRQTPILQSTRNGPNARSRISASQSNSPLSVFGSPRYG
jgi:hypothetical protein